MRCTHPKNRIRDIAPLLIWCSCCGAIRYWREGSRWEVPRPHLRQQDRKIEEQPPNGSDG